MASEAKVDLSEWNKALKEYMVYTKRTLAEVVNEKAFQVAKAASKLTYKADRGEIAEEMRKSVPAFMRINKGRKPGLYGAAMREAVNEKIKKRQKASAFLRAGWLVSVAKFGNAIGKEVDKNAIRMSKSGDLFGDAKIAKPGIVVVAEMENHAFARQLEEATRGLPHAQKGLQAAIDQWTRSMKVYVERKMQAMTNKIVGRALR